MRMKIDEFIIYFQSSLIPEYLGEITTLSDCKVIIHPRLVKLNRIDNKIYILNAKLQVVVGIVHDPCRTGRHHDPRD